MNKPMKTNPAIIYFLAIALYFLLPAFKLQALKVPKGEYLGEEKPGLTAKIFAPGFVSLEDRVEFNCAWSPGGKEFYFSIDGPNQQYIIMMTVEEKGLWSKPFTAPFSGKYNDLEISISPRGDRCFFSSDRPINEETKKDFDIWYVEKTGNRWGVPQHAGFNVNSEKSEWFPTASLKGTLYFCGRKGGIYRSKWQAGEYVTAEMIGDFYNSTVKGGHPYIAPDESYIITSFNMGADAKGQWDLYISFRTPGGGWTESKKLGNEINTSDNEDMPQVSPDGKYFFFTRVAKNSKGKEQGDIYWIDAGILRK